MDLVKIKDKTFRPYISTSEIESIVAHLASQINRDYQEKSPLFLVILNGAFIFASDLIRKVEVGCRVSCIKVSSYQGVQSRGKADTLLGLQENLRDEDVIIVEDIVETGNSMEHILNMVQQQHPRSLRVCTLLFKPENFRKQFPVHYVGKSVSQEFVVGYGFDYDGYGRNLPMIYQLTNA